MSPSRTSQAVALTRAGMSRHAWLRLLADTGWLVSSQADPREDTAGEGRSLLMVARTG